MNVQRFKKYRHFVFWTLVIFMFIKPIICFLIFGVLLILFASQAFLILKELKKSGSECSGNVIGFETDNDGNKISLVEFTTRNNETIKSTPYLYGTVSFNLDFSSKKLKIKEVKIVYLPNNPNLFIVKNDNVFITLIFGLFGLIGIGLIIISILDLFGFITLF